MSITATHTEHHNTSARTLLMAFELSDGCCPREQCSKKGKRCFDAKSPLGLGAGGGGPLKCRACQASRRIDGVASSTVRLTPNAETHRGTRAC